MAEVFTLELLRKLKQHAAAHALPIDCYAIMTEPQARVLCEREGVVYAPDKHGRVLVGGAWVHIGGLSL